MISYSLNIIMFAKTGHRLANYFHKFMMINPLAPLYYSKSSPIKMGYLEEYCFASFTSSLLAI